jgi:HEAT repeat protein
VTTVKKNSATTAKPIADPDPTTPQETVSKPEPSDPLPPPQTYTRPDDAAVSALAETPLEELMALLADAKQRDAASRAAVQRGQAAVLPLVAALQNDDPQVRAAAAFTLGQIGADARPAVEALQAQAEKDDNEIARDAAVFALDAIQEPES